MTALLGEVATLTQEFLEGLSPPTSHESLRVFKPLPCRLESPFLTGRMAVMITDLFVEL